MKIRHFIIFSVIIFFLSGCTNKKSIDGVYRYYYGKRDGYSVWIVDGYKVRHKIYNSFLYGGNEQRYPFTPKGEIWIDNAISCEEFEMTLIHELNERHLMAKFGWTYEKAHDSSLQLEVKTRRLYEGICREHEASLHKVGVTDHDNVKEIKDIPDSIQLQNIYRLPIGQRNGINIWIVDGYLIRKNIYPDFGFSGNDLTCHFIPQKEIWIDGQVSCEETEYSIAIEMMERQEMTKGKSYSDAYEDAVTENTLQRDKMSLLIRHHNPLFLPDTITRDAGIIDPKEK
jgi:adenylylsulfate kinase-like enzyme